MEKAKASSRGVWYRGKRAKTGNSLGLRFDKSLFQSHPEFSGEVRAHVIAPGRMLVVAADDVQPRREDDPVIGAFLGFLARDMASHPRQIRVLDRKLMKRAEALAASIRVDPDEDLGSDSLI